MIAAIAAVVAIAGCTPTPSGGGGGSTNYTQCPTVGAGQVRVAVVVNGTALGSNAAPVVCVVVAQNSTGVGALYARATRLGLPVPRFDNSGLLCAIDGVPIAPTCGNLGPNGYEYWTYWIGGGPSWTFAPVGPASRLMTDGTVEGWRFILGGPDTAPSQPSTFAQLVS